MAISRLKSVRRWLDETLPVVCATLCFAPVRACAQQAQDSDAPALERLAWMAKNQRGMWNVNANEGAFLRAQVVKAKAKRALEIGTSNGYSSTWIALGLRQTGGHLTTLEIDSARAKLAQENFRVARVESLITLQHGDALEEIPKLQGPFELVFIDAWKQDNIKYLEMVLPKVPPGGVIVAHNVNDERYLMEDFIERITTDPQLKTTSANPGPGGFSVSVKQPGK
jgi:predicted O-methyltransferase YrrM